MAENGYYYIEVPLKNSAVFSFVAVFKESTQYVRNYTLPFNMIGITSRCADEESSVITNLQTGEKIYSHLNDIHLIPCGLSQCYAHTFRQEHLSIHFKLELYPGVDVFSGQPRMFCFQSEEIRKKAQQIFEIPDTIFKLSCCQELALRICHRFWPKEYPFDAEKMKPYDDVLYFIRKHANALTTVDELAAIRHCSVGTFTREFHEVFKIPPKLFLEKELYRQAAQMLLDPASSVKSVADKLKFSSEFYFSRFFKRLSGTAPRDFRKSGRK